MRASAELPEIAATALGLMVETTVSANAGRVEDARRAGAEAIALLDRIGWRNVVGWVLTPLGFADLSVGEPATAAARLADHAERAVRAGVIEEAPGGSLFTADAAEALISVGRLNEAERIVGWLEERGTVFGRAWAVAAGARGRGLLLAARGNLPAAERALGCALVAHERQPMPVERARSLLALGRIRRQRRKPRAARRALDGALAGFTSAGSPRWAEQAAAEIAQLGSGSQQLTPAEERVVRLAATGWTNREVASSLAVSHKTVEAHLARAYHKLGIRSRAELGAHVARRHG